MAIFIIFVAFIASQKCYFVKTRGNLRCFLTVVVVIGFQRNLSAK